MPSVFVNRLVTYCSVGFLGLCGIVLVGMNARAAAGDPLGERFYGLLQGAQDMLAVFVAIGVLMLMSAAVGAVGVRTRIKGVLMTHFVTFAILIVVQFTTAGIFFEFGKQSTLNEYEATFKSEWVRLAAKAQNAASSSNGKSSKEFLAYVQDLGTCCGFDDVSSADQNPSWLDCDSSRTTTCKDTFLDMVSGSIQQKSVFVFVSGSIQSVVLLIIAGLVCRKAAGPGIQKVKSQVGSVRLPNV